MCVLKLMMLMSIAGGQMNMGKSVMGLLIAQPKKKFAKP